MDELENERLRKLKDLHALRGEESDADPASPDLLDQLLAGDVNLSSAPEHMLRRMFESFRLQVRYDKVASWATCRVAIREETLDQLLTDSSALLAAETNDPDGERSFLRRELVINGTFFVPTTPLAKPAPPERRAHDPLVAGSSPAGAAHLLALLRVSGHFGVTREIRQRSAVLLPASISGVASDPYPWLRASPISGTWL